MKNRNVTRMLTTMVSAAMILAQIGSPMCAMAANEENEDALSEEVIESDEFEEVEEDFVEIEMEDDTSEYEEEVLVEGSEDGLIPPINVTWDGLGWVKFKPVSADALYYEVEVYKDGEDCGGWGIGDVTRSLDTEGYFRHYVGDDFEGSGLYTAKVYVKKNDGDGSEKVYAIDNPEIFWTEPEQHLPAAVNLRWENRDSDHFAVAVCDPVDNAYRYWWELHDNGKYVSGRGTIKNECDFSEKIGDVSGHNYTFIVRQVVSDDLSMFANGPSSEESDILTLDGTIIHTQEDIVDLGKDVNSSNVDEKVQQVKDLDNATLKTSLQTDNAALEAMGRIENEYKDVKNIEVLPATSDVEKISADQIEMTGAALNVSSGTVQLNVKDQKENGSDLINTNLYTNIIAFDMSVNSSEGIDFSKELEVPVTISMPIPSGMNTSIMVILHYRADGTEELITPRIENGKAIFAITHFSTFAFAEKKDSSSNAGLGNTFSKEDAISGVKVMDGNHTLKLETSSDGFFTAAKILDSNGSVDTSINSYIANIVTKYAADGTPEEFYSLIFRNGVWDPSYDTVKDGLYTYLGEQYSVAGGTVNLNVNSLTYTGDIDGWKYIILGHVVKNHAGLVAYGPADDLHWFWIDNEGGCDTEYNAIVKWNGADFLVHGGRLRTDYTGFTYDPQNPSVWYHITNGQVWGDGVITDQSIAGGTLTCTVENGLVKEMNQPTTNPGVNKEEYMVFGSYEQDGDLSNGTEPIEWQVLGTDENGTLLVSRYILDKEPKDISNSFDYENGVQLKNWLNDFYNSSFTDEEKTIISGAENDKTFILSLNDLIKNYEFSYLDDISSIDFGDRGFAGYSKELIIAPTVYAEQQGVKVSSISRDMFEEKYRNLGYTEDVIGRTGANWIIPDQTMQATAIGFVNGLVLADGCATSKAKYITSYDMYPGIRPAMYIKK